MTVRLADDGTIILEEACPAADSEVLLSHLLAVDCPCVDWRTCDGAHTAVVQVLIAAASFRILRLQGAPRNAFLRDMVAPLIVKPLE